MQTTPSVTFRRIAPAPVLDADVRARLAKLERFHPNILAGDVMVERIQRHHERGNRIRVRVELLVPGGIIVVSHQSNERGTATPLDRETHKSAEVDPQRKHARVAIREAFETARRQLQDFGRRQRGAVKTRARRAA